MSLSFVEGAVSVVNKVVDVIDQAVVDPDKKLELKKQLSQASYMLNLAQVKLNHAEAQSGHIFIAGWRPALGWICVLAVGYVTLGQHLLSWLAVAAGLDVPTLPVVDIDLLYSLLVGMLGLGMGGLRTFEKVKGAAREGLERRGTRDDVAQRVRTQL